MKVTWLRQPCSTLQSNGSWQVHMRFFVWTARRRSWFIWQHFLLTGLVVLFLIVSGLKPFTSGFDTPVCCVSIDLYEYIVYLCIMYCIFYCFLQMNLLLRSRIYITKYVQKLPARLCSVYWRSSVVDSFDQVFANQMLSGTKFSKTIKEMFPKWKNSTTSNSDQTSQLDLLPSPYVIVRWGTFVLITLALSLFIYPCLSGFSRGPVELGNYWDPRQCPGVVNRGSLIVLKIYCLSHLS